MTKTGLIAGLPCKLSVSGVENIILTRTGVTQIAIDGTPITQLIEQNGKGKQIEINIEMMPKTVFDSLKTLLNTNIENGTSITVNGTGDTGNFSLSVVPVMPNPINFQSFINERVRNISLKFITT